MIDKISSSMSLKPIRPCDRSIFLLKSCLSNNELPNIWLLIIVAVTMPMVDAKAKPYEPVSSKTIIIIESGAPITAPATAAIPQITSSGP